MCVGFASWSPSKRVREPLVKAAHSCSIAVLLSLTGSVTPACSKLSKYCFRRRPPPYPPRSPFLLTMRWQGIKIAMRFMPFARPTAGSPMANAKS